MNTSMRPIAAGLASLGRNQDSMLVHMTPGEVHGLQGLALAHGGSLTINPHTGLPEAGFLSSILPAVAGMALTPYLGPIGAGLLVGGLSTLTTGSLTKGLMAGLGTWGGGALGEAFAGMSPEAAAAAQKSVEAAQAGLATPEPIIDWPTTASSPSPSSAMSLPGDYGQTIGEQFAQSNAPLSAPPVNVVPPSTPAATMEDYRSAVMAPDGTQYVAPGTPAYTPAAKPDVTLSNMASGLKSVITDPATGKQFVKDNYGKLGAAAAPLIPLAAQSMAKQPTLQGVPPGGIAGTYSGGAGSKYGFSQGQVNPRFGLPGEPYFLDRGFTSYAAGGSIPPMATNYPQSNITPSTYATSPQSPLPSEVFDEYGPRIDPFTGEQRMAAGGIASLREYAAGGRLLDGPGDGMSDSIPAVIKGPKPQRAALADGEFVIPSDVVSHLGNGSTKAGAQRLYKMMDKVRMARVGTKKQGRQINAEKFIPA